MTYCESCERDKFSKTMENLREAGLTFKWKPTGETREVQKWFGRGIKIQQKELKIQMALDIGPMGVYRWKTITVKKVKK